MFNINIKFDESNFEKDILNHIKKSVNNIVGNLKCKTHPDKDTIIKISTNKIEIDACCSEFEQLLKTKLDNIRI